jgi:SagB-type dehydrogenase family enzyme
MENRMSTIPLDLATDDVKLPPPAQFLGVTLDLALRSRRSRRAFAAEPLSLEHVATLLWAAFGVNRRDSGGRTAPSAHDWREIDLYVCAAEGCFAYDAPSHRLALVKAEDLRAATGRQDFVASAPLNLVYVADFARMTDASDEERRFLAGADAGCIAQNVYLCCAALGLATVVRGLIDREGLAAALGLQPAQRIALAQSVGRPAAA